MALDDDGYIVAWRVRHLALRPDVGLLFLRALPGRAGLPLCLVLPQSLSLVLVGTLEAELLRLFRIAHGLVELVWRGIDNSEVARARSIAQAGADLSKLVRCDVTGDHHAIGFG